MVEELTVKTLDDLVDVFGAVEQTIVSADSYLECLPGSSVVSMIPEILLSSVPITIIPPLVSVLSTHNFPALLHGSPTIHSVLLVSSNSYGS